MSYKSRSLFGLIEDINTSLFLPHIQRPFVWEEDRMLRLFDSLMRNYPIQTLLFWRTRDEIKARKFMEQIEEDPNLSAYYEPNMSKAGVEKVFVLDGQQRLQTLYAIFRGAILSETGTRQEAYFDVTSGDTLADTGLLYRLRFASESLSLPWFRVADLLGKYSQRNAEELADELNDNFDALNAEKIEAQREGLESERDRAKRVRRNISQLVSLLREERHFWVQQLDGVADKFPYKTVLDIFVRVNSGGMKLDASDLMFEVPPVFWTGR